MTKKIIAFLLIVIGFSVSYAQDDDRPQNTGDNFSLEGALSLFKKAASLKEFEKMLNKENNSVNNLDLNNDGDIDYIMVDDIQEGNNHVIVLSTYINDNEKQDIATIGIEKNGDESATLQIEGDQDLYAQNTFVEPSDNIDAYSGGKGGPNVPEIITTQLVVNVWFWPSVRFLYAPTYIAWHSPWHWGLYPRWWRPWRPYRFSVFYGNCTPFRAYYRRVPMRRIMVAHNIYAPRRHFSTFVVHNRRGGPMIRYEGRGRGHGHGRGRNRR